MAVKTRRGILRICILQEDGDFWLRKQVPCEISELIALSDRLGFDGAAFPCLNSAHDFTLPSEDVFTARRWQALSLVISPFKNPFRKTSVYPNDPSISSTDTRSCEPNTCRDTKPQTCKKETRGKLECTPTSKLDGYAELLAQVEWGVYCGARSVLLPSLSDMTGSDVDFIDYANILQSLPTTSSLQYLQCVDLDDWAAWNAVRLSMVTDFPLKVALKLKLGRPNTESEHDDEEDKEYDEICTYARWEAECISAIIMEASSGSISPSAPTRNFLIDMMKRGALFYVKTNYLQHEGKGADHQTGNNQQETHKQQGSDKQRETDKQQDTDKEVDANRRVDEATERDGTAEERRLAELLQFLGDTWSSLPAMTWEEEARQGFGDYIQVPLQPLVENLEAATYEVFEADRTKYDLYEQALHRHFTLLQRTQSPRPLHIAYCGGGRGGLMEATFRAVRTSGLDTTKWICKFSVVEKNPHAARNLRAKVCNLNMEESDELWRSVELTECDMREWRPESPIDVLVSELLGSIGDNELSPECLAPLEKYLAPQGVLLPKSYTSYLEPVSAAPVYNSVHNCKLLQTGHVVDFRSSFYPSHTGALELFHFEHPSSHHDFTQAATLTWTIEKTCTIHGFAGYFSSDLLHGVICSTSPVDRTKGMVSWFPMFIPLDRPHHVQKGEFVTARFWRKNDNLKVWYEWCLLEPTRTTIHNHNGTQWSIQK